MERPMNAIQTITLAAVLAVALASAAAAETKRIYGIFYEGCEHVCEGFKAALADSGFDAELVVRDIAMDKSVLPRAVEEARALPADLVLTYGTSVTLGTIGTLANADDPRYLNDIPAVFTMVADPFGSNIAAGFDGSGRPNVAGTFNRVPEAVNIEVIRQYDRSFGKLGLLYNNDEANSVAKRNEIAGIAPSLGIELVALELDPGNPGQPDPATIAERLAELRKHGVRWVYLGSSSFLSRNGAAFTEAAVENGLAVVSPYESMVRDHKALLSIAAREEDVGRLAAEQTLRILRDGVTPGDLPIVRATEFAYVVNMDVARQLNLFPPFAFMQAAEVVND